MKKNIVCLIIIICVFCNNSPAFASAIEKRSIDQLFTQTISEENFSAVQKATQGEEKEKTNSENNRYIVVSGITDQEVYDYMFFELNGFYDVLGDVLEDKGMDIRDAYIGKPIKVDLCPDDFQQYIFPVFIEDEVVGTVLIEKMYNIFAPEGRFSIGVGDVFWDIITYNTGNLYLFMYDHSIFASDNSGIQEIYGHSKMADSPEVRQQAQFSEDANRIDISMELLPLDKIGSQIEFINSLEALKTEELY